MAITGQKRADKPAVEKMVGVFEAKVLAVNPTREEIEELTGYEKEEDPEYFKPEYELKNEEGEVIGVTKQLTVVFYLEDVKTGHRFQVRFFLVDQNRRSTQNPDSLQWMNRHGIASWGRNLDVFDQEKYNWFREPGGLRMAKRGEAELYEFLRSWLLIDFRNDPEAELHLDWARLMRNDVREIRDVMRTDLAGTVMCLATVGTKDGENGPVEIQQVYNRKFLPGSYIKAFRMRGRKAPKALEKFIKEITDPEFGVKDFYEMDELKPYNAEANVAAGNATHIPSQEAAGVPAEYRSAAPDDLSY